MLWEGMSVRMFILLTLLVRLLTDSMFSRKEAAQLK